MCELNVPQFMQATATNVVAAERWYSGPPREEAVNSFRRALRRLILDLNGDGQRLWELFDRRHAGRLQRVELRLESVLWVRVVGCTWEPRSYFRKHFAYCPKLMHLAAA